MSYGDRSYTALVNWRQKAEKKATNTINARVNAGPARRNAATETRLRGKVLVPRVPKKTFKVR